MNHQLIIRKCSRNGFKTKHEKLLKILRSAHITNMLYLHLDRRNKGGSGELKQVLKFTGEISNILSLVNASEPVIVLSSGDI